MQYLINHLLETSARRWPENVAVEDGDRTITYRELDALSNRIANLLLGLDVERGARVGLYLDKSIEAIAAIYGTLKAGAAYVPLDPQAPAPRLGYMARDAGVRVILTGAEKEDVWEELVAEAPCLQALAVLNAASAPSLPGIQMLTTVDLASCGDHRPRVPVIDCDLAYILYTSGSTGAPKGVMLTHRNCLAFVQWAAEEFAVTSHDRLSSHPPLHFDMSTFDLFAAALAGATVVLVSSRVSVFPSEVRNFIGAARITVWYSVPSILTMLVLRGGLELGAFPRLRMILFAGEVFPRRHLSRLVGLLPHVRFANLYGPTETNVCTWWEVPPQLEGHGEEIPIGRPIANVDTFVLTDKEKPAAPGEIGELCVRGPTVMQGYLGEPQATASSLIQGTFDGLLNQPAYRTGDLVQELADGNYRYLGRRDAQIKSRGYRIDLGDVESALHIHPAVVECAVVAVPDDVITNRLQAYVTARRELSGAELAGFCAGQIPAYMVPESFALVESLPRTSTGKIDRTALAAAASTG